MVSSSRNHSLFITTYNFLYKNNTKHAPTKDVCSRPLSKEPYPLSYVRRSKRRIGIVKSAGLEEVVQLRLKSIVACCNREAISGRTVTVYLAEEERANCEMDHSLSPTENVDYLHIA